MVKDLEIPTLKLASKYKEFSKPFRATFGPQPNHKHDRAEGHIWNHVLQPKSIGRAIMEERTELFRFFTGLENNNLSTVYQRQAAIRTHHSIDHCGLEADFYLLPMNQSTKIKP